MPREVASDPRGMRKAAEEGLGGALLADPTGPWAQGCLRMIPGGEAGLWLASQLRRSCGGSASVLSGTCGATAVS